MKHVSISNAALITIRSSEFCHFVPFISYVMPLSWRGKKTRHFSRNDVVFHRSSLGHGPSPSHDLATSMMSVSWLDIFSSLAISSSSLRKITKEKLCSLHFLRPFFLLFFLRQRRSHSSSEGESLHAWRRIWFMSSKEALFLYPPPHSLRNVPIHEVGSALQWGDAWFFSPLTKNRLPIWTRFLLVTFHLRGLFYVETFFVLLRFVA